MPPRRSRVQTGAWQRTAARASCVPWRTRREMEESAAEALDVESAFEQLAAPQAGQGEGQRGADAGR